MEKDVILKPKENGTITFSIRVSKELVEKYNDLANKSGYSRNELIGKAMLHYINQVRLVRPEDKSE